MGLSANDIQVANPYIVSGEEHRFLAAEQLRETGIEFGAALLEPIGRNTASVLTAQQNRIDPIREAATDNRNALIHATSCIVSLVGVDNLVVIETPDAILVADKSRTARMSNTSPMR